MYLCNSVRVVLFTLLAIQENSAVCVEDMKLLSFATHYVHVGVSYNMYIGIFCYI